MFKMQHPQDLLSRMFILEYIRELGPEMMRTKLSKEDKATWTYQYGDGVDVKFDFNWEYLVFVASLEELSQKAEKFLVEIEVIDKKRQKKIKEIHEERLLEELRAPVDINLMDIAKANVKEMNNAIIK